MRKGVAMVEVTFALVILSIIGLIAYSKFINVPSQTKAKEGTVSTVETIYNGTIARKDRYQPAGGTFLGTNAEEVWPYVQGKIALNGTGATSYFDDMLLSDGCMYQVATDTDSDVGNRRFKMFVDCSQAKADNEWGEKNAILVQNDIIKFFKDRVGTATVVHTATAITDNMSADASGNAGTNDDAVFGIGNLK